MENTRDHSLCEQNTRWTYKYGSMSAYSHALSLNEGFLPVKRSSFQSCEHLKSWPSVKRSNRWFSTCMLVPPYVHLASAWHHSHDEWWIHPCYSLLTFFCFCVLLWMPMEERGLGMRLILLSWHCPLLRKAKVLLNDFTPTYRYPVLILPSDLGWFSTPHLCSVICIETNI